MLSCSFATLRLVLNRLRHAAAVAVGVCVLGVALTIPAPAADFESLVIITKSGTRTFTVEIAQTNEERATGLMYRTALPDGTGMLFDFRPEQQVTMWMKNTLIPLDMLFIRADGRISRIAENTTIKSEAIIPSGGPVGAVLEISGGSAKKLGIAVGDRVVGAFLGKN